MTLLAVKGGWVRTRQNTVIHHWRFEDGKTVPNQGSSFPLAPPNRGWYCWAYPENDREFEQWMNINCPTADYTHRFNSGDPMYTVYITEPLEAVVFTLKYL